MPPSPSRPVTPSSTSSSQPPTPSSKKSKNAAKKARQAAAKAAAAAAAEEVEAAQLPAVEGPKVIDATRADEGEEEEGIEVEPEMGLGEPRPVPTEAAEDEGVGEQEPSELPLEDDTPEEEVGDEFFEAPVEGEAEGGVEDASASAVAAAEATIELVNLQDGTGLDPAEELNLQRSPPHLPTLDQPPVPKLEDEYPIQSSPPQSPTQLAHANDPTPASPTSPKSSFPSDFPSTLSADTPDHPSTSSSAHFTTSSPSPLTPPATDPSALEAHDQLSPLPPIAVEPSSPFGRERHFSLESEPETPTGPVSLAAMVRKGSLPGLERKASVSTQNGDGDGFADVSLAEHEGVRSSVVGEIPAWKGKGRAVEGEEDKDLPGVPTPRRHSSAGSLDSSGYMFLMQRLEAQNAMLDGGSPETNKRASFINAERNKAAFSATRAAHESQGAASRRSGTDPSINWDFWGEIIADYEKVATEQPRALSRAIQKGIPPALRGMVWQLMSASKSQNLEGLYAQLLQQTSPHEKSIGRDLSRTFPKHDYFIDPAGTGQEQLFNVVKAYSIHDEEVGYTQGLQFIVGPLLLNMPDDEAFSVLVRLMQSYDLRSHYTPNMPGLQLRLFQFDRLLEELVPAVFLHLLRQGIKSSMYASQWFLTLFGYRFPLELVAAVFDLVFAEGVEAVFRFGVALLKRNEEKVCGMEFEELAEFLKNGLFEVYAPAPDDDSDDPLYNAAEFVREALQIKITPFMLDQFAGEWNDLCRQQQAHTAEVDQLRAANRRLSGQVRSLESSLAQMNQEHCELVKQVVMAKVEREELEEELVKYKMAYADLSHQQALESSGLPSARSIQQTKAAQDREETLRRGSAASAFSFFSGLGGGGGNGSGGGGSDKKGASDMSRSQSEDGPGAGGNGGTASGSTTPASSSGGWGLPSFVPGLGRRGTDA